MRRPHRLSCALLVFSVLALSLSVASCGGGSGGGNSDLVLVGFNVPNIAGVPLNQPLMFTFSNNIDPASITPDTLRVVGAIGPNFETTVVDGNLVALLPRSPNFEDYSDSGLLPGVRYTVSLATYPAPATIRTLDGKPLLDAESFQFDTVPAPDFIEPRRPIEHGLAPSQGGASDDEGCLNNADNSLETSKQFGSDCITLADGSCAGPRLICLQNEGAPEIILNECEPTHNDQAVGVPSAVTPGFVNLPALRVRLNEPLDPVSVVPYVPTEKFGLNVQLWLVGDTDRVPLPPRQIRTNKPLIVQSLTQTEIILVASNEDIDGDPVGGVPQGTYLVNLTSAITDLPGTALDTSGRPSPAVGGFQDIEDNVNASGDVPPGYRMYFVTLVVPGSPQSIIESFGTNLSEWGDAASGADEPGVYTQTDLRTPDAGDDLLFVRIPGSLNPSPTSPAYTLVSTSTQVGQSTTANWNGGFRFFGLPGLSVNTDVNDGSGLLKALWKPYAGDGLDGVFLSDNDGTEKQLFTDPGTSSDGDGIWEFESFHLQAADTLKVTGSQPLVIFCRGDFIIDGAVHIDGAKGGDGLDTDGDVRYTNAGSIPAFGAGGVPGSGGGQGGDGGDPLNGLGTGLGEVGSPFLTVMATGLTDGGGGGALDPTGGGGGGMDALGDPGTFADGTPDTNGGAIAASALLESLLADFTPDRGYSPNANGSGGTGGGGGGLNDSDTSGAPNNGDDGGGGGGGGGGGIYVLAYGDVIIRGTITVDGGEGGDTYAVGDQTVDLGADGVAGGEGVDADLVTGVNPLATPSGAGGPGGGGSGGSLFFMGRTGVEITSTATLSAQGAAGGAAGDADLIGGPGSDGIIIVGSMGGAAITVDGTASVTPMERPLDYKPTVDLASTGLSEWVDLFTPTGEFEKFSWSSNFLTLQGLGLIQGIDFDALLEVQGADSLSPKPDEGVPTTATGATNWSVINTNTAAENSVEFPGASPIDGKRYIRWRWRFRVAGAYPGFTTALPSIQSFTIEFER